jgi:hypothetical protein
MHRGAENIAAADWRFQQGEFRTKVQPSCFVVLLRFRDGLSLPDSTILSAMTVYPRDKMVSGVQARRS